MNNLVSSDINKNSWFWRELKSKGWLLLFSNIFNEDNIYEMYLIIIIIIIIIIIKIPKKKTKNK